MVELRDINTLKLVLELEPRECVKSHRLQKKNLVKYKFIKKGDKNFRYIKGSGPLKILEIKL